MKVKKIAGALQFKCESAKEAVHMMAPLDVIFFNYDIYVLDETFCVTWLPKRGHYVAYKKTARK